MTWTVGYTPAEAKAIKDEVVHYTAVKNEVEVGAGENIDMKQFEVGMRSLLDTYIQADPVEQVATFDKGLVQLIVERGADAIDALPGGIKKNPEAVAETITYPDWASNEAGTRRVDQTGQAARRRYTSRTVHSRRPSTIVLSRHRTPSAQRPKADAPLN
jgi:hypothetical protein